MADDLDPAAVARAAEAMSDYLTMLGVDPDDVGEGVAAGTTAHVLARAALAAARDGEAAGREAVDDVLNRWSTGPALAQMVVAEVRGALLADAPTVTTEQAQQDAWTAAVAAYPTEHVGYDKPVPSICQCDECYRREAQRNAYMAGRLDALGVEVREP